MADAATDYLVDFLQTRDRAPASDLDHALDLARSLREPVPESGDDFESLLRTIADGAAKAFDTAGPGYLAFIPGGGLFAASIADYVACTVNRFVGIWNLSLIHI